jgi:hypothetical protein
MLKYASTQVMSKVLAPVGVSRRELRRFAHRHQFQYEVRPGFLYVRSRAISSRCNDNFDEFPAEELEKAYASFKGKPVFVNHVNNNHHRARGVIIDAALHKDSNRDGSRDWWIEVLQEIDAVRFPRLAKEILAGNIARTSMGCDVSHSICSACGNKATTPAEYCAHIPASKGMKLYRTTASGQKVGDIIRETCFGLKFFENSLLVEPPADPTAHFTGVDASGLDKAAALSQKERATPAMPSHTLPDHAAPRLAETSHAVNQQRTASVDAVSKLAYGETKAPEDVDTLREDSCPVCGDRDTYDGATCAVCAYVSPPKIFQDPDLELARQMDLRKDISEFNGQPGQPVDPNALDAQGNPIPGASPEEQVPGSLPGEVQAEVQTADGSEGQMPGQDGQMAPQPGEPIDPAMLGPDGQPLQQGQQMIGPDGMPLPQQGQQPMLGPDGMPIGPQPLPADAMSGDGQPFNPGPNEPQGPGGPEQPLGPEDLDSDGQVPNPEAGQGVPGTPEDGVPDLMCPACGFTADATQPVSVDMDTANLPDAGVATQDGVAAGDVCPNCGTGLLLSPAEVQGEASVPVTV